MEILDNLKYEKYYKSKGYKFIGGVDEAGRGPLVGPVVAACVILPEEFLLPGLTDSKKLTEKKREELFPLIKEQAIAYGIGIIDNDVIDKVNILEATKLAMMDAINNMNVKCDMILIDGNMKFDFDNYESIVKGDLKSISISAASILAKVTRDHILLELDKKYPMYGFKKHKGYPTKEHVLAIEKYGIIKEHRKTFNPVSKYV